VQCRVTCGIAAIDRSGTVHHVGSDQNTVRLGTRFAIVGLTVGMCVVEIVRGERVEGVRRQNATADLALPPGTLPRPQRSNSRTRVGVVGMCFTGGFALATAVDESVSAAVMSQPSVPFPIGRERRADLGLSTDETSEVVRRSRSGLCLMVCGSARTRRSPPADSLHMPTPSEHSVLAGEVRVRRTLHTSLASASSPSFGKPSRRSGLSADQAVGPLRPRVRRRRWRRRYAVRRRQVVHAGYPSARPRWRPGWRSC